MTVFVVLRLVEGSKPGFCMEGESHAEASQGEVTARAVGGDTNLKG